MRIREITLIQGVFFIFFEHYQKWGILNNLVIGVSFNHTGKLFWLGVG